MKLEFYRRLLENSVSNVPDGWQSECAAQLSEIFAKPGHGHFPIWQQAVEQLAHFTPTSIDLNQAVPRIGSATDVDTPEIIQQGLMQLQPWRKGPFDFCGINLDAEWRCDLKWQRLAPHLPNLSSKTVLDVGCGNGYYMLRMLGCGAKQVIGVDPTLIFMAQFYALTQNVQPSLNAHLLPLPFEQLSPQLNQFDVVFSMGVLYHRRNPNEHCQHLYARVADQGWCLLETLVLNVAGDQQLIPRDRYAGMRNVWSIPSPECVMKWLRQNGFVDVQCHSIDITSIHEQRATQWMHNYSLKNFLHPDDVNLTIEGHPAPARAFFSARKIS